MKTKVTYSDVKKALEMGFVSPLNSGEIYQTYEFAGHVDVDTPAQMKAPAFYVNVNGKSIVGGHKWADVSDAVAETMSTGIQYVGRVLNGVFVPKAA